MRNLLLTALVLVVIGVPAGAQEAQRTPPGGDTVGSDRNLQRGDVRTAPSPSPDQNQRMTNSAGTSTGYEKVPAYSGTSVDESRTRQANSGATGLQGQTSATAGRRQARRRSARGAPSTSATRHHPKRRTPRSKANSSSPPR